LKRATANNDVYREVGSGIILFTYVIEEIWSCFSGRPWAFFDRKHDNVMQNQNLVHIQTAAAAVTMA